MGSPVEVAVVGGGFSGAMVAIHLSRAARDHSGLAGRDGGIHVTLYEPNKQPGRGRAYSTKSPIHRLNVRASGMSAFASEPDDFLRWTRHRDATLQAEAFVERGIYGEYVSERLERERTKSAGLLELAADEILDVEPTASGSRLMTRSGNVRAADRIVLATGHPLPAPPVPLNERVLESGRYEQDPWSDQALGPLQERVGEPASMLLLLGSGLTAVDVLLESRRRGFEGAIHILSRRGLLPLAHEPLPGKIAGAAPEIGKGRIRAMMRRLRDHARASSDWRSTFDALRPETQALWRSLPLPEKRRFLRHVRPYWEIHRHRVAPEIARLVRAELESGRTCLHAARVLGIDAVQDGLLVQYRERGSSEIRQLTVGRLINCTGPNTGIHMCDSELTRALLRRGLCRADELGIGLACDPHGAVLDADGRISDRLYTLGPLRKGELWESTAVPEIRVQAEVVARRIMEGLR